MDKFALTNENYDGVVSALLGNGELCTTVGPTGFHTPPNQQTDIAHKTQHFVLARKDWGQEAPRTCSDFVFNLGSLMPSWGSTKTKAASTSASSLKTNLVKYGLVTVRQSGEWRSIALLIQTVESFLSTSPLD